MVLRYGGVIAANAKRRSQLSWELCRYEAGRHVAPYRLVLPLYRQASPAHLKKLFTLCLRLRYGYAA